MIRIVLCCQHGASTDLLAVKIEEAARTKGIDASVTAYSYSQIGNVIDSADIVLLAPQIRFKLGSFQKEYADKNVPFVLVEPSDYGMLRGEKVLNDCLAVLGQQK